MITARPMDQHQYAAVDYPQVGYQGSVRVESIGGVQHMWPVTRPTSYPAYPVPAIRPTLVRGTGTNLVLTQPTVEMDPSNPRTWQRPYRFT